MIGPEEEAYAMLSKYAVLIEKTMPGSMTLLICGSRNVFYRSFVSYAAHVKGFRWCRPVIIIDAGLHKADHGGQLFVATALDENNLLYTLLFCVARIEKEWS